MCCGCVAFQRWRHEACMLLFFPNRWWVYRGGTIGEGLDHMSQPGAAGLSSTMRARAALQMGQVSSTWGAKAASNAPRRPRTSATPAVEPPAASQGSATGLLQGLRGMLGASTKQATPEHSTPSAAAAVLASIRSKQGSTSERLPLMTGSSSSSSAVGGGVARRGSGGGSLDSIFARLDGRGTGRIDDDEDF